MKIIRSHIVRRFISLFLIICLSSCLVCCSSEKAKPATDENTGSSASGSDEYSFSAVEDFFIEARSAVNKLPDIDFGGKELRILADDYSMILPENASNAYNLAVLYRNKLVEDKLNVKITTVEKSEAGLLDTISKENSDENCCELAYIPMKTLPIAIEQGLISDVNILPFTDFSAEYYNSNAQNALSLGRVNYGICSSATFSPENEYCVYFNQHIIENLGIDSPESLFYNNNWTWDTLGGYASMAYKDIDGNGYFDENDRYGLTATFSDSELIDVMCASSNLRFVENTPSYLSLCYNNQKTLDLMPTAQYLLAQETFFNDADKVNSTAKGLFINGGSLFMIGTLSEANDLSTMKDNFGILPLPKLYSSDDLYYTALSSDAPVICMLSGCSDTELAGAALEALSAASYHSLEKAYTEVYMQYYLRTESSVRMLPEIYKNIYYEVCFVLGDTYAEIKQFTISILKNSIIKKGAFESGYKVAEKEFNEFVSKGYIDFK